MNIQRLEDTPQILRLLTVLMLVLPIVGCTTDCGKIRAGREKYHDVCIAVKFQQHIERSGVTDTRNEPKEFGTGLDDAGERIELVGDRLDKLESNRRYNLRGDFVEVDQKTRFRVLESSDLDSSTIITLILLGFAGFCSLAYFWAGRVVSGQPRKPLK